MSKHVVVVVLGDTGRSPRMQYHAMSLAAMEEVGTVTLIGYEGEKCADALRTNAKVVDRRIAPLKTTFLPIAFLQTVLKGIYLMLMLLCTLLALPHFDVVLIQNPPSSPILLAMILVKILRYDDNIALILDWHNLGFSLYPARRRNSWIVTMTRLFEKHLSHSCDMHITVSSAMKAWLEKNFQITASVLYDRPPRSVFRHALAGVERVSVAERHALLSKLSLTDTQLFPNSSSNNTSTIQTMVDKKGRIVMREDRAVLLISSTSWTEDEDFTILQRALVRLDRKLTTRREKDSSKKGRIVVVITGKGPLKEAFMDEWNREIQPKLNYIALVCAWLEMADYPVLLACADMGVCLHTASAGIDLPMKVVDMFGSGLPVTAIKYRAIKELVRHGDNGFVFRNHSELSAQLFRLFCDFPTESALKELSDMSQASREIGSWEDNWCEHMKPIVRQSFVLKCKVGLRVVMNMIFVLLAVISIVLRLLIRIYMVW